VIGPVGWRADGFGYSDAAIVVVAAAAVVVVDVAAGDVVSVAAPVAVQWVHVFQRAGHST